MKLAKPLALLLLLAAPGTARAGAGRTAGNFLKLGVSPRAVALGDTFVGMADDVNAIYYNPAGLGFLERQEVSAMHNKYFEGIQQQWAAYAFPTKYLGTFAAGVNLLRVKPFAAYDEFDKPVGTVDARDMAVNVAYAREFGKTRWMSLGVNAKYIDSKLGSYSGHAGALDFGALWKYGRQGPYDVVYRFGGAVRNLGTKMKYISEEYLLPQSLHMGVSRNAPFPQPFVDMRWILLLEATVPNDRLPYFSGGLEVLPVREFAVRVGYKHNQDAGIGLSAGIGFRSLNRGFTSRLWPEISIDYAFVDYGRLEQAHRVGVTIRFGPNKRGEYDWPTGLGSEFESIY